MRAFSTSGARHFAEGFVPTGPNVGVLRYVEATHGSSSTLSEGSASFDELRNVLLRETDRYIFLATSNFVRTLEGLRASSSAWCVVGLYYSSWYAAHAILGILGCWIRSPTRWIEVVDSNPGNQRLQYHTQRYTRGLSSHRLFWHAYYAAVTPLVSWVSADASRAVSPISSNEFWFIDLRNRVNYRPFEAFTLMNDFDSLYDRSRIPTCFPGELNSAYQVCQSFLIALKELVQYTGLETDVFNPSTNRSTAIRRRINGSKSRDLTAFSKGLRSVVEF